MAGFVVLGMALLWLAVILLRAVWFRPKKQPQTEAQPLDFDREGAVCALQALVRCQTVSHVDKALEQDGEFEKLISLLPRLYPRVFAACAFHRLPDRGLLLHWPGKAHDAPAVMMAHYDVVPADEAQWEHPPFAGEIHNGVLWGRGTLDTKATLNGALWAADTLIAQGFTPRQDVYFAFSGGEEVNGPGAAHIVEYFRSHHIQPALVLDEGGAVVEKVFPGVKAPCGLIGIAEKGMMNVKFQVSSGGGHASAPPVHTPIGTLARACLRLEKHPFPMRLTKPARELFDTLGRHASFGYRIIFANLWCFRPLLGLFARVSGGEINALVRTTLAFTQMQGSQARNVLPTQASVVANMRLAPGETVESALAHLKKTLKDPAVEVEVLSAFPPSSVSQTQGEAWERVAASVSQTWPGCIVSPYLMVQCADARHYSGLCDRVYRFCAMDLTAQERKTIHGNNEGIRIDAIGKTVEFYIRLLCGC